MSEAQSEVVYSTDRATIVCADALTYLPTLVTESVDLVLTDPPYGVEWRSNHRAQQFDLLDNDTPADRAGIREVLEHSVRLVGQSRHLYVFGPADVLEGLKVSATAALVWDKATPGMGDLSAPWAPAHEPITFAVSKHRHGGESGRDALPVRMRKGSVLRFPRPTGRKVRHPSEKPTPLLRELIESSSRGGDLVFDPFAGSGSTGVAAVLAGRRTLLIDSSRQWCDLSAERITAAEAHYDAGRWL